MTKPDNRNNCDIHKYIHYRACPDKHLNCIHTRFFKVSVISRELVNLIIFTNKGLHYSYVSYVLTNGGIKLINLLLKLLKSREAYHNENKNHNKHNRHCHRKHYRKAGLDVNCHDYTADKHTGGTKRHTKKHIYKVLKLGNVVCHSRNKRACREFVNIGK